MGSGEKLALSNDNTGLVPVFGSSLKLEGIELSIFHATCSQSILLPHVQVWLCSIIIIIHNDQPNSIL